MHPPSGHPDLIVAAFGVAGLHLGKGHPHEGSFGSGLGSRELEGCGDRVNGLVDFFPFHHAGDAGSCDGQERDDGEDDEDEFGQGKS